MLTRRASASVMQPGALRHRGSKGQSTLVRAAVVACMGFAGATSGISPVQAATVTYDWATVVNNSYFTPVSATAKFFSYNQPSVSNQGLVVFRARAKNPSGGGGGGGEAGGGPVHGVYSRDMSSAGEPITPLAVNKGTVSPVPVTVPAPNNLGAKFIEQPSFPRIDADTGTVAFRAVTQPTLEYAISVDPDTGSVTTTRGGTSGVYTNPGGTLVTGASKLGSVPYPLGGNPDLSYFQVPGTNGVAFDQFPGAPSVDGDVVVFKGNWTDPTAGSKTGVYFRDVIADGGTSPVYRIAESGMDIPGAPGKTFGSTAPPSAADGKVVFTGLDNEAAPTAGGIFLADIEMDPMLRRLLGIGDPIPNLAAGLMFKSIGEGLSFDGRYVGFWGAWGDEMRLVDLYCPVDGNEDRNLWCNDPDNPDPDQDDADSSHYVKEVPLHQGFFAYDTQLSVASLIVQTGDTIDGRTIDDLLYWNFSGFAPGIGESPSEDQEPARWRSAAFMALDGDRFVFKAHTDGGPDGGPVDGLYGRFGFGSELFTLLDTTMDGSVLDPNAAGQTIASLGIERDGFRNGWLAINAGMAGTDAAGNAISWAGIYVAKVPEPGTLSLLLAGLAGLLGSRARIRRDA
jgi:hypothetical protein